MKKAIYTNLFWAALGISAFAVCAAAQTQINIPGPAGSGNFGSQVFSLPNGNFVVTDPGYDITTPTLVQNVGAVYLYNGATGALINTLTGSKANDGVGGGNNSITILNNGNYIVGSPNWRDYGRRSRDVLQRRNGLRGRLRFGGEFAGRLDGKRPGRRRFRSAHCIAERQLPRA